MAKPAKTREIPPRAGLGRFRYEYGAEPLHLLAVAASLLVLAYALLRITAIPGTGQILLWIAVAAVAHDLIALPFYSLLMRIAEGAAGAVIGTRAGMIAALNHVRIPAAISALLLLVFLPLILRIDPDSYEAVTGVGLDPYLGRWLLLSAALFAVSALVYAVRMRRSSGAGDEAPAREREPGPRDHSGPVSAFWGVATTVVLAGGALAALWVIAAAIVGLLSSGF